MSNLRTITRVVTPRPVIEGAGVHLRRSIALPELDYVDPFLLLDHFESDNPDDYIKGFPLHPHRGIETVTYMLAGEVSHRDSLGNAGTIGPGDVQWMTAGSGIRHEEMPAPRDGRMAGFQLWVNLPARLKMTAPRYQEVLAADVPVAHRAGVEVRVIAGEVDGVAGPVHEIYAQPSYLDVTLAPGAAFNHDLPADHACFAYIFRGAAQVGETTVSALGLALLSAGDRVTLTAAEAGARLLLVSGLPLGEPIARYGPFVMNTRAEIETALRELRDGTFIKK
jgi:hypothetical protein